MRGKLNHMEGHNWILFKRIKYLCQVFFGVLLDIIFDLKPSVILLGNEAHARRVIITADSKGEGETWGKLRKEFSDQVPGMAAQRVFGEQWALTLTCPALSPASAFPTSHGADLCSPASSHRMCCSETSLKFTPLCQAFPPCTGPSTGSATSTCQPG